MKSKFIVLGFRDQGGCRLLFSVKMSYKVCPLKLLGDRRVSLPQTFPQKESVIVEGNCTTNSVQTVPGNLIVLCDSNGEWNTSQLKDRCVCKEGMENVGGICQGVLFPFHFLLWNLMQLVHVFLPCMFYVLNS